MNDAHRAMSRSVRKARISTSALRKRRYHKAVVPARRTVMRSHPAKKTLWIYSVYLGTVNKPMRILKPSEIVQEGSIITG